MKQEAAVSAPKPVVMDLNDETKPLVEKEINKCSWSFFKQACCGALKETCAETFSGEDPRAKVFLEQHKNFLPKLP